MHMITARAGIMMAVKPMLTPLEIVGEMYVTIFDKLTRVLSRGWG